MYREIETFGAHGWFLQTFRSYFVRPLRDIRVIIELSAITIENHVQTDRLISCYDMFYILLTKI